MPDMLVDSVGVSLEYLVNPEDMALGGLIFPGNAGFWYSPWSAAVVPDCRPFAEQDLFLKIQR